MMSGEIPVLGGELDPSHETLPAIFSFEETFVYLRFLTYSLSDDVILS
jgi:hypothetical protein